VQAYFYFPGDISHARIHVALSAWAPDPENGRLRTKQVPYGNSNFEIVLNEIISPDHLSSSPASVENRISH
jgi:hypothetical protein